MRNFRDYLGLSFPVFYDEGGEVTALFADLAGFEEGIFPTPGVILVGADGTALYYNQGVEQEVVEELIRQELGL